MRQSTKDRAWGIEYLRKRWVGRADLEVNWEKIAQNKGDEHVVRYLQKQGVYRVGIIVEVDEAAQVIIVFTGSERSTVKLRTVSGSGFKESELDDRLVEHIVRRYYDEEEEPPEEEEQAHIAKVQWPTASNTFHTLFLSESNEGLYKGRPFGRLVYDSHQQVLIIPPLETAVPLPQNRLHESEVLNSVAELYTNSRVVTNFKSASWVCSGASHHIRMVDNRGDCAGFAFTELSWDPHRQELNFPRYRDMYLPLPKDKPSETVLLSTLRNMYRGTSVVCNFDLVQWVCDGVRHTLFLVNEQGLYKNMFFTDIAWDKAYGVLMLPQYNNVSLPVDRDGAQDVLRKLKAVFHGSRVAHNFAAELGTKVIKTPAPVVIYEDPVRLVDVLSPRYDSGKTSPQVSFRMPTERDLLDQNLRRFGFEEFEVPADGNCQFRSVAHHLFGDHTQHLEVRRDVIKHLKKHKAQYAPFVEDDFAVFLKRMARSDIWGDHVTLQAAADKYKLLFNVVTSHLYDAGEKGGWLHKIRPKDSKGKKTEPKASYWLSYCEESHAEHYNPITRQTKPSVVV